MDSSFYRDPASPGRPPPRPPKTKLPSSEELPGGLKRPRPSPSMPLIGLGRCDCDPTSNSVCIKDSIFWYSVFVMTQRNTLLHFRFKILIKSGQQYFQNLCNRVMY